MNLAHAINHAWWCASRRCAHRTYRALHSPQSAQHAILRSILESNASSTFGRKHNFHRITSPSDFVRRVPISTYEDLEPWILRAASGEPEVLTTEPITRLVPTSGSTSARKLIPFTATLQRQFNTAISPWIDSLFTQDKDLSKGPAYWSISPAIKHPQYHPIPTGFDDDSAYLGGVLGPLLSTALAVPPCVARIHDIHDFRYATLLSLLRRPDLRFISVWHPSFFTILLDQLPACWNPLLADIAQGSCSLPTLDDDTRRALTTRPNPIRTRALEAVGPHDPAHIWPHLCTISCWADAAASQPAQELAARLHHANLQKKGLLATEGVVTFPLANVHPLAIRSHYFEFLNEHARALPAHELQLGEEYEVLLTTGAGFYRYRLGDRVRVDAFCHNTPSLTLVGRSDNVCDLTGEKLSEAFVARVIEKWCAHFNLSPTFAMLAPTDTRTPPTYTLFTNTPIADTHAAAHALDTMLQANPHYHWARRAGQLGPVTLAKISADAHATYTAVLHARGTRLGDIKPTRLSKLTIWHTAFRRHEHARTKLPPPSTSLSTAQTQ